MSPPVYLILVSLLLVAAYVTFRGFVRRDYQRKGRLTTFTSVLGGLIFFLLGTFTWVDLPADWPPADTSPALQVTGWTLVVIGLAGLLIGMLRLGLRRSVGQEVNTLRQSGLYGMTRNPQIIACALAVVGYALLWPSWHSLGWVILFAAIAHMMVLTEEEHLLRTHGDEYVRYCERVPRYLRLPRRS